MTPPPTYGPDAIRLLAERTEYEAWLLEAAYAIAEQELFPSFPDAVIYPVDRSRPEFIAHMRGNIVMGDWRPGFLNAGAPLVFIATFKLLDMFIEWVLEENGFPSTFHFQEKLKQLDRPLLFPALIESRPWLRERLEGLYRTLEPLRGTIVHDRHFRVSDGTIRVASSKGKVVGPQIEIGPAELRKLALTVVSILRYVDGTWSLDQYRERMLRHDVDGLASFHALPSLGQRRPFFPTVRVFSTDTDPRRVDASAIYTDLAGRYSTNDCMFDLRVLTVKEGAVVDAFLFPWALLENGGPEWSRGINLEAFRVQIPDDINPKHLESPEAG
jgi:hypothetical protein